MEPALKLEYYHEPIRSAVQPSVNKQRKPHAAAPLLICLMAAVVVCCAVFYLHQRVVTMQLSVKIAQLEQRLAQLKQEQDHLLLTLEQQNRLANIEKFAREQLGMIDPVHTEMLVMQTKKAPKIDNSGWTDSEVPERSNLFTVVAGWLNGLLPVGGVEAGRIGE